MNKAIIWAAIILLSPGLLSAESKTRENGKAKKTEKTARNDIHPKPKEYFEDVLIPHLWEGTKASFSDQTVPFWTLSAMGAALTQDDKARDWFQDRHPLGQWRNLGNAWGEGYTQGAVALAFWSAGWAADNQKIASTGEVLVEAEILNGIYTTLFKSIVGRERPDHSGADSFPSGHASDSFCFAAVIDSRLGHGWAIPAYSLAVLTGMSRMDSDKHFLSDVVMGAGLGMIIGYSVSKNHDDWPYEKRWHHADKKDGLDKISLVPMASPHFHDGFGFGVYVPLE